MNIYVKELTIKHSLNIPDTIPVYTKVPCSAKDVKGLWKAVIVYEASIDGEKSHQQDNIATIENGIKHLKQKIELFCGQ